MEKNVFNMLLEIYSTFISIDRIPRKVHRFEVKSQNFF